MENVVQNDCYEIVPSIFLHTAGGGWTMVSNTVKEDTHSWGTESAWTDTTILGDISTSDSSDYKNTFWSVASNDIMYKVGLDGEYGVFNDCLQGNLLPRYLFSKLDYGERSLILYRWPGNSIIL